ncbi:MAG TPA: hypothetical protein VGQ83_16280 [Polyangia bacterium]
MRVAGGLAALSLISCLSSVGCSCSQREALGASPDAGIDAVIPDGGHPDRGAGPEAGRDGGARADAACEGAWIRAPRPIIGAELVNGVGARMGATDRLRVTVSLEHGCEALAGVAVTIMQGDATDFVGLAATAWTLPAPPQDPGCYPPGPVTAEWIVAVPGREQGNLIVSVQDTAFPSSWTGLRYGRQYCSGLPDCQCWGDRPPGDVPEGGTCLTDCSCAAGLSCIGFPGGVTGAPTWQCLRPCNDALDCAGGERCGSFVEGPAAVCQAAGGGCASDPDCPPGFVCDPAHERCVDQRTTMTGMACACDADCAAGQHCTDLGADRAPGCMFRCLRPAECPPDNGLFYFSCATDNLCHPTDG